MLNELKNANKVVGLKQVTRSIERNSVIKVFLAKDISPDVYNKIVSLCRDNSIEIEYTDSMKQLGGICGIDVPAAVAAMVK